MNANARRGRSDINNANRDQGDDVLKNKRLKEIREAYEWHKQTPRQQNEGLKKAGDSLLENARRNGASESNISYLRGCMEAADSILGDFSDEEDKRDEIISTSFLYRSPGSLPRNITITSEGSRHWVQATVNDYGSIVYLPESKEFGEFDDVGEEPDEEFPDEKHKTAHILTFSGGIETPWAHNGIFEQVLLVPGGVLGGVNNEAPPGKFFSGKSITDPRLRSTWSPAPDGQTCIRFSFMKRMDGELIPDKAALDAKNRITYPTMRPEIREKCWKDSLLAYWCPVLKRFISEGDRLRQEHWFHNGDGSAQQRYFYNQQEMLDMHGGLESLPLNIDGDVSVLGITGAAEAVAKRVKGAAARGEVVDLDSKMPAAKIPGSKKRKAMPDTCKSR